MTQHLLEIVCAELSGLRGDQDDLGLGFAYWAGGIFAYESHLVRTLVADGAVAALTQPDIGFNIAAEHTGGVLHGVLIGISSI